MLARFGFRWILAVTMTLTHLGLIGVVLYRESPTRKPLMALDASGYRLAALQAVEIAPTPAKSKTSPLVKADYALNLPALALGYILVGLLQWHGDPALTAVSTVFVAFLWFRIGRWIDDQRTGIDPRSKSRPGLRLVARVLLRIFAAIFLLVGLSGFTVYQHRTSDSDALCELIVLWCALYLIGSFWGAHRLKKKALNPC
jgi:hypothetical protein